MEVVRLPCVKHVCRLEKVERIQLSVDCCVRTYVRVYVHVCLCACMHAYVPFCLTVSLSSHAFVCVVLGCVRMCTVYISPACSAYKANS